VLRTPTTSPSQEPHIKLDANIAGCFPGNAMVVVMKQQQQVTIMKDLKVGDFIQTPEQFEPILFMSRHWVEEKSANHDNKIHDTLVYRGDSGQFQYLNFQTAQHDNEVQAITISKRHLLLVHDFETNTTKFRPAGSVRKFKDAIVLKNGTFTKVIEIQSVIREGQYYPVTKSGTMIVDGYIVSCFNQDAMEHELWVKFGVNIIHHIYQIVPTYVYVMMIDMIDLVLDTVVDKLGVVVETIKFYFFIYK
jgi:hypothetical protein